MRKRASAIIIKDKKLLLVTDKDANFYWTPGGKLDKGETFKEALCREIAEEINTGIIKIIPYCKYIASQEKMPNFIVPPSEVECFLVEINSKVKPSAEVASYIWATKEEIEKITITNGLRRNVINKLIKEGLL